MGEVDHTDSTAVWGFCTSTLCLGKLMLPCSEGPDSSHVIIVAERLSSAQSSEVPYLCMGSCASKDGPSIHSLVTTISSTVHVRKRCDKDTPPFSDNTQKSWSAKFRR